MGNVMSDQSNIGKVIREVFETIAGIIVVLYFMSIFGLGFVLVAWADYGAGNLRMESAIMITLLDIFISVIILIAVKDKRRIMKMQSGATNGRR